MEVFKFVADFGGALFSVLSVLALVMVTVRHFLLKNRPTHLHIAMHFLRPKGEKLALKFPTLDILMLPEMFDYLTATWLLLCAKRWSVCSEFGPILTIPQNCNRVRFARFLPERKHFLQPVLQWLSSKNFGDWRDRAARAARDPASDPQEELFVVALVYEGSSRSIRGLVVPVKVLEVLLHEPDCIHSEPHENYTGAPERIEVLATIARAWLQWKEGKQPGLAMGLLEL